MQFHEPDKSYIIYFNVVSFLYFYITFELLHFELLLNQRTSNGLIILYKIIKNKLCSKWKKRFFLMNSLNFYSLFILPLLVCRQLDCNKYLFDLMYFIIQQSWLGKLEKIIFIFRVKWLMIFSKIPSVEKSFLKHQLFFSIYLYSFIKY